jgi:2,3-dimethylmalate lyase
VSTSVRSLLAKAEGPLVVTGVQDPLSALIAQRAGFAALAVSTFAVSTSLGLTDLGLPTMSEIVEVAGRIARRVEIPVLCDADTGFGGPLNVRRTVQELEAGAVAGVYIADSVTPPNKRDRPVVSEAEMLAKIRAALDARGSDDFFVIVRCDASPSLGAEEAIRRAGRYAAAGADAVLVLDPGEDNGIREMNRSRSVPSVGVVSPLHRPIRTVDEMTGLGYRIVVQAFPALLAAVKAMTRVTRAVRETGGLAAVADDLSELSELTDLAGLPEMRALEEAYGFGS